MLYWYKKAERKTASTNLTWLCYVLYFLKALYFHISTRIFHNMFICFVFDSLCYRFVFECFVPNIRLLLTRTYEVVDFTVLTYSTLSVDRMKLSQ